MTIMESGVVCVVARTIHMANMGQNDLLVFKMSMTLLIWGCCQVRIPVTIMEQSLIDGQLIANDANWTSLPSEASLSIGQRHFM